MQAAIQDVADADAPEELESEWDRLSSRLRSSRTQLGRLLSVGEIRQTIEAGAPA